MATIQADSCVDTDLTEVIAHIATTIGGTTPQPQMQYIPPTGGTTTGISIGPSGRMHSTSASNVALDSQLPGAADVSGTFRITNLGSLVDNNNQGRLIRCDATLANFLWIRLNINVPGTPTWQLVQSVAGSAGVIGGTTAVVSPATSDVYDVTFSVVGTTLNASYTKNGGGSLTLFGGAVTVAVVANGRAGIKGDGIVTDTTGLHISALTLTGTAPVGSMTVSPTTGGIGSTATVTFTGVGTAWNSFTTFVDLTGGITFTGVVVTGAGAATATAHYNSGTGAHTIGNTFDVGTATITLAVVPVLTLTESAPAVIDGGTVSLTGSVTGGTPALVAGVTGGGGISTIAPTTSVPFTYTAPSSGTGTATVTLSAAGASPVTKTIFYGPRVEWCEVGIASPTSVTAQVYDTSNNPVGPVYGPLTALSGPKGGYAIAAVLPDLTTLYRVTFDDGNGTQTGGVFLTGPTTLNAVNVVGALPSNVTQWLTVVPNALVTGRVDASAGAVADKTGYALTGAEHTAIGTTDVPAGLIAGGYTGARATKLDFLDASILTRSTYAGGDTSGTTALLARIPSVLTIAGGKVAATTAAGDGVDAAAIKTTIGVAGAGLTGIPGGGGGTVTTPIGTSIAPSTAGVLTIQGFPTGVIYNVQFLRNERTGETQQIPAGGQTIDTNTNYVFNMGANVFSSFIVGDKFVPVGVKVSVS